MSRENAFMTQHKLINNKQYKFVGNTLLKESSYSCKNK